MYKLVIAEKPSVGKTIAKVLGADSNNDGYVSGNGYIVSWCIGHLIGLANPEAYGEEYKTWSFDNLPIKPAQYKFAVNPDTVKQFNILRKLMNDSSVTEIVCATDAGREGECIFRYVYNAVKCQKPFKRLWVSSMEDIAIKEGFENLSPGYKYDNLYEAGLCRAKADWVVGMNASRLFTIRYDTKLSIGRVQTPTLAMIVERNNKIKNFVKEKFFNVEIGTKEFPNFAVSERFDSEAEATKTATACNGSYAVVKRVMSEKKTAKPPKLYDLTTLQREANRYYGYTAQQTLDIVQSLYEKKLCTYPRTDSQYITEDMHTSFVAAVDTAKKYTGITSENVNPMPVINNSKVSDHHAIIVTQALDDYFIPDLKESEENILYLISARMIMASSEAHIYTATTIQLTCANTLFNAKGKNVIQQGWKAQELLMKSKIKKSNANDEENSDEEKVLPSVNEGDVLDPVIAQKSEHWTSPPKPYTEDTLLSAMETAGNKEYSEEADVEKKGLGTPATRANIIETLIKRSYVERKGKQLIATQKGESLIAAVPIEVKSPKMTADWETRLQAIERNEETSNSFMNDINSYVSNLVSNYAVKVENNDNFKNGIGKCPRCGKLVCETQKAYSCNGGKDGCGFILWKNIAGKNITTLQAATLIAKKKTNIIKGFKGKAGKDFEAKLVLKPDFTIGFEFPNKK